MKLTISILLSIALSSSVPAQGNPYQVRYHGGTLQSRVSKDDWDNKLTILSDQLLLELKDGQKISIDPKTVTSISYGRSATRRVAAWVAMGILVSPIAFMGLFNENVKHFVSIEYTTSDDKKAGILLQAHKDNYRNVLAMLRGATGKEIEMEKKGKNKKP
jgi:hypothetical protein